jgi:alkylation response protein AidB-like acyl-CoA dehydrogenase
MNLSFDEQQEMMRKSFKRFLEDQYPVEKARAFMEEKREFDRDLWNGIAELGITAILIDEEYGGLGLTPIDQLVIQEETGRFLTPAPIKANAIASNLLNLAANAASYREILQEICEGNKICTLAMMESSGKWDEPSSTQVREGSNHYILNGTKISVPFVAMCDYVVVLAQGDHGNADFYLVPIEQEGVSYRRLKTIDPTQPWYEITFQNVELKKDAKLINGEFPLTERALELGAIFTCVETVGGMEQVLNLASAYAKEREQFGKLIGSFQAIKHKLADMLVGIEKTKALSYYAALEVVEQTETKVMSMASAKVLSVGIYHSLVREGIQLFGGIGYTWEHDMHLYLRRSIVNQTEFGDVRTYRQKIKKVLDLDTSNLLVGMK